MTDESKSEGESRTDHRGSDHQHIEKDAEYTGIIRGMQKDIQRTEREREIERAIGGNIATILRGLSNECSGNRSEMCRKINERLLESHDGPDEEFQELSRGTLYNYMDKYGVT